MYMCMSLHEQMQGMKALLQMQACSWQPCFLTPCWHARRPANACGMQQVLISATHCRLLPAGIVLQLQLWSPPPPAGVTTAGQRLPRICCPALQPRGGQKEGRQGGSHQRWQQQLR